MNDTASQIASHLSTIRSCWSSTADPIDAGQGRGTGNPMPSSTIVLRADITLTLAHWVHALIDDHPVVIQHLETTIQPTTNPDIYPPVLYRVVTGTIDCTDVTAMCDLLLREVQRIVEHWEGGRYAEAMAAELEPLAKAAAYVDHPPRRDRLTLGTCSCGRDVSAVAVPWVRWPNPTTDPDELPHWTDWMPAWEQRIRCPGCHTTRTLTEWLAEIASPRRLLAAPEIVDLIHAELGMRYDPKTVRVWANRGMFRGRGYASDGRALYDRVQVLAALIDRERAQKRGA